MTRILMAALLLALAGAGHAQMYKWTDKDGKVHYSDQPPPPDAKQQAAPARDAVPLSAPAPAGKFRPEEEAALGMLCGLAITEFGCMIELKRFCTLEEMVKGFGSTPQPFPKDPNSDPNYRYAIVLRGSDINLTATPRRPGLAAFFNDGDGVTYNESGPASPRDKKVKGGNNCVGHAK